MGLGDRGMNTRSPQSRCLSLEVATGLPAVHDRPSGLDLAQDFMGALDQLAGFELPGNPVDQLIAARAHTIPGSVSQKGLKRLIGSSRVAREDRILNQLRRAD